VSNSRITNKEDYGRHIPLRCKNHKNLRWSTKNIGSIGSRTIFFSGVNGKETSVNDYVKKEGYFGVVNKHECICDVKDLEVVINEINNNLNFPEHETTK